MNEQGHGGARKGAGRRGRLTVKQELQLSQLMDEAFPPEKRREAVEKQVALALGGDSEAFKVLMAYTYGKPKEKVEQSGAVRIEVVYVDPTGTP